MRCLHSLLSATQVGSLLLIADPRDDGDGVDGDVNGGQEGGQVGVQVATQVGGLLLIADPRDDADVAVDSLEVAGEVYNDDDNGGTPISGNPKS